MHHPCRPPLPDPATPPLPDRTATAPLPPPAAAAPCPRRRPPQLRPAPHLAPPPLLTAITSEGRVEREGEEQRDLGGEGADAEARLAAGERGAGGERGRPPVACPRMRRRQP
ncbi:unnamed protein product [Urochloa humidicola]